MRIHKAEIATVEEIQAISNWHKKNQKKMMKTGFKVELNGESLNSSTPHYQILPNVTPSEREMIVDWT